MSTDQPTNPHRGSDFTEFLTEERLMPTPRTDAIAHRGYHTTAYIAEMTSLHRELERELAAERALADRLIDELQWWSDHYKTADDQEALATWKEARRGND